MKLNEFIQTNFIDQLPTRSLQFSNIFRFAASVIVGIGLVRLGVSQYNVGRVEFLLFAVFFWSGLWHMGLKDSLLSRYYDYQEKDRKYVFFEYYLLHILAACATAGIMVVLIYNSIYFGLDLNDLTTVIPQIILYSVLLLLAAPLDFYLHLSGRHKEVIVYNFIWFVAHVSIIIYTMVAWSSLSALLTGLSVLIGIKTVLTWLVIYQESAVRWSFPAIKTIGLFSFPLVLQSFVGVSTQAVDSYLVSDYFDTATFAVFRFGAKEIPLSMLLVSGLVAACIPLYKKDRSAALDHMISEFRKMVKILFPLGIVLILASPFLYRLIYGIEYVQSATIFNIYILLLISRLFLPHVILYGHNKNWLLVLTITIEVVINALLSILFIEYFGLVGVAYATVVAYLFQKAVFMLYVKYQLGISSSLYTDWPLFLKYTCALLFTFIMVQIYYPTLLSWI